LKRFPNCGSITLDPVLASLSPKVGVWKKYFFVDVLMKGSALRVYSNYLAVPEEEPSHVSSLF
jgi:hypothetical protein